MLNIGASYSTLSSTDLLKNVISLYQIDNPIKCEFWFRGINDSYKISTQKTNYILRVYRKNWRTLPEINFEIDALNFVHRKGANVSYPIKRIDEEYITKINTPEGTRYAIVTAFAEGEELTYETAQDAFLYGTKVAQFHTFSEGFKTDHKRFELDTTHLLLEPIKEIKPFLSNRLDDWKFVKDFGENLQQTVENVNLENTDYGLCHGDFHNGNGHKLSNDITFFDFDCCGIGYRSYDIAVFRWGARLQEKENERWEAFIEGYKTKRSVSNSDLKLTNAFIAIRTVWLMGLHMGNANDFGKGWINNQYLDRQLKFLKKIEKEHFW
jgi:Ser/Thr protein kinase RdoA (MazF antagonist)